MLVLHKTPIEEIFQKLRARKVCRSLRTAVDKFGIHFGCIGLILGKDVVNICWNGIDVEEIEDVFMSQYEYIRYTEAANGSTNMIHNGHEKLIDGENFVERAGKDFKIVSKHAQKIEIFNSNDDNIVTTLNEFLKFETCILVKDVKLWNLSLDDVLTNLPRFNAKELKTIKLEWVKSIDQFKRIIHLD
ncbi:DUF38 domain-containing protein [Caenorhabditis elegans]|uniref:DUF38 domain-containing protein n=1 Tax=Caenorhabditis elegans TaxID=6239 RepID=Q9TZ29_CAEEL|nr:DUF38 domain-containing protein [Caenorhabditis elegans]CCD73257.2 DUF38 domain-containing protein [Caenorhabditis elegans]